MVPRRRRRRPKPVPPPGPDPYWSRDIFTRPLSGFGHAMLPNRVPVTVQRFVDAAMAQQAMDYWNGLAGWTMFIPAATDYEIDIDYQGPLVGSTCESKPYENAYHSHCHIVMGFNANDPSENRDRVLMHELGHALGFGHLERGVMHLTIPDPIYDRWILQVAGYRP